MPNTRSPGDQVVQGVRCTSLLSSLLPELPHCQINPQLHLYCIFFRVSGLLKYAPSKLFLDRLLIVDYFQGQKQPPSQAQQKRNNYVNFTFSDVSHLIIPKMSPYFNTLSTNKCSKQEYSWNFSFDYLWCKKWVQFAHPFCCPKHFVFLSNFASLQFI